MKNSLKQNKKLFYTFVLIVLFSRNVYAQDWAPLGSKWLYTFDPSTEADGIYDYDKYEIVRDTLIDGRTVRIIEGTNHSSQNGTSLFIREFIYKENNQIYFYKWGTHHLLYNFTVSLGDSYVAQTNLGANLSSIFTCQVKFDFTSNGYNNTYFDFAANGDINYGSEVIDQIGSMHHFFPDTSEISIPEYKRLRCYITEDTLNWYQDYCYDFCEYYRTAYISDLKTADLKFYPNPISNLSTVLIPEEFGNISSIKIRGINGQSISKFIIQNRNIWLDKSDYESGIYFVEVETSKQKFRGKFVVE